MLGMGGVAGPPQHRPGRVGRAGGLTWGVWADQPGLKTKAWSVLFGMTDTSPVEASSAAIT